MNKQENDQNMIWKTNREMVLVQERPENAYFGQAYDFMRMWLNGQKDFDLQTSGSTGLPKTIQVSRQQLAGSAAMTGQALGLGAGTRALVCLNVAYVAGLMMLVRGMELNWELTMIKPSSNPLLDLPPDAQFDFAALVPMQLASCFENKETESRINSFGKILLGGAPVAVSLLRKLAHVSIPVYQSYGMTETVSHVALRKLNSPDLQEHYRLLPGVTFGSDERGCLYVSGPMTKGIKVQTNDLVEIVSQDSFIWLGRYDTVINSGGIKIIPDRVDEKIAAVFYDAGYNGSFFTWYQPDEKLGQKLILIMEKTDTDPDEDRIINEIRKSVSAYETPKHVYFADRFIKTATDKTDKRRTVQMLFQKING
jgi:O-succinylbenzoic acid--CoA ligase